MFENNLNKLSNIALIILFFYNFIEAGQAKILKKEDTLFEKYLVEDDFKIVFKKVDFKKVLNSLSEYKKAENEYKRYLEEQQRVLSEKAEKIKKESEDLEGKWNNTKSKLQEITDKYEYEEEFTNEEKNYKIQKENLEEKYRLLMAEQNTMENDARVKRNELFNPIEKKVTRFIDEYTTILSEKISEIRGKSNKKHLKILVLHAETIANSETYLKKIQNLDITNEVIQFIKQNNKSIDNDEKKGIDLKEKLKDKKNKK